MLILGIDPGMEGAAALVGPDSAIIFDLQTVPLDSPEGTITRRVHGPSLTAFVQEHFGGQPVLVVIEGLSAGGRDSSKQSVGSQYRTRGTIECALEVLGLKVRDVSPARWKKLYGIKGKTEAGATQQALQLARGFYPGLAHDLRLAKHHNRAESLLIARWAQKVLL